MPDWSARATASRTAWLGALLLSVLALFAPGDGGASGLFPGSDKVGHLGLFALLAGTGVWAGLRRWPWAMVLIGYAGLSELIQGAVLAGRAGDWRDVVADGVGAALGLTVGWACVRRPARRKAATDEGSGLPA